MGGFIVPVICAKRMFTVHLFFRFNAFGSLYSTLISCIIYLLKLKTRERYILQSEANKFFSTENKHKTLAGLKTIESFVLEVLRLHPPAHKIFGIARRQFIISSQFKQFTIPEGSLLCGDIYHSHRDAHYFNNPYNFDCKRFKQTPELKDHLFSFGGIFSNKDLATHNCLGQHLAMEILKISVVHLCFYDIEATVMPVWSGTKYGRLIASDKPLSIKTFGVEKGHT